MSYARLTDQEILVALDACAGLPSTVEITYELWQQHGVGSCSRHSIYRWLTKLEKAGVLDKEISLTGGTGIGTALWTRTDPTDASASDEAAEEKPGSRAEE